MTGRVRPIATVVLSGATATFFTFVILRINVGALRDEQLDYGHVAFAGRYMQRRDPFLGLRINVSAVCDQYFSHGSLTPEACRIQGRHATRGLCIDVSPFGYQQFRNGCVVAPAKPDDFALIPDLSALEER